MVCFAAFYIPYVIKFGEHPFSKYSNLSDNLNIQFFQINIFQSFTKILVNYKKLVWPEMSRSHVRFPTVRSSSTRTTRKRPSIVRIVHVEYHIFKELAPFTYPTTIYLYIVHTHTYVHKTPSHIHTHVCTHSLAIIGDERACSLMEPDVARL